MDTFIGLFLQPLLEAMFEPWRWLCSSSYRAQLSRDLAQAGKFKIVFVYSWGVVLFLFSLLVVAIFTLPVWWKLTKLAGVH